MRSLQWYKRGAAYRSRLPENLCKSVKSVGHKKEVFSPPTEQGELPFQFSAQYEGEER